MLISFKPNMCHISAAPTPQLECSFSITLSLPIVCSQPAGIRRSTSARDRRNREEEQDACAARRGVSKRTQIIKAAGGVAYEEHDDGEEEGEGGQLA